MTAVLSKQPEIRELFTKLIQQNTLQHAYIFEGVAGAGKFELAIWVAQNLFCHKRNEDGTPCLACNNCLRIVQREHPDVSIVEPDGLSIKVDQVRAIKEEFSKSGMESRKKVLIVQDMDKMTTGAANSLLKFIEEPEGEITIFLLTTSLQQMLPTIVSRSQIIHFPVQEIEDRIESIVGQDIPKGSATLLAYLTQDTREAVAIYEGENFSQLVDTVWQWFLRLSHKDPEAFTFVQTHLMSLAENREVSSRILDLLILVYRDVTAVCFEQDRVLAFSKYEMELHKRATVSIQHELAENLQVILDGKKKLRSHVQAQGVFEQIALKITRLTPQ